MQITNVIESGGFTVLYHSTGHDLSSPKSLASFFNFFSISFIFELSPVHYDSFQSLISHQPGHPTLNCIKPGWVLQYNPYMVERSQSKFSNRRKSREYATDFLVMRPSLVRKMMDARARLLAMETNCSNAVSSPDFYTEDDLPGIGLGKNILMEVDRLRGAVSLRRLQTRRKNFLHRQYSLGIDTYTIAIRMYALRGLAASVVLGLVLTRNCHNLTKIFTPGINWV
jgi:hypothetical protein